MADTVADVLVRLGVDTAGLRAGFRDARSQTSRFAEDISQVFSARGGLLGIIGSATRSVGSVIPGPLGFVVRGIGSVFASIGRAISGLFTQAARDIARQIRRHFEQITTAYREGSATLGQTIESLEAERASAIRRLSQIGRASCRERV